MNDYIQNVFGVLKNLLNLSDDKIFDKTQCDYLEKKLNSKTFELPAIIVFENDYFEPSINQTGIDLSNEVRTSIDFTIYIFSYDVDELVSLENRFIDSLSIEKNIVDNDCIRSATLSYDKDFEINRRTFTLDSGKQRYRSTLKIKYNDIILSKINVNPIKVELDKNFQLQIMKQLSLLNDTCSLIDNEISKLLEINELKNFTTLEEKLNNMSAEIHNQYQELIEQKSKLIEQIDYMYTFENLCQTKITPDDNGFKECYNYMISDKLNLVNATGKYKTRRENDEEERRKEIERLEKLRKHFSKSGDKQLNRYTDAVVQDIKETLYANIQLPIYGGSTFNEWYNLFNENKLTYPNIRVFDTIKYDLSLRSFQNEGDDSELITHIYDVCALPVSYWVSIDIYTQNEEQAKFIENLLITEYSSEKKLKVEDCNFENEKTLIKLEIDNDFEINRKQYGDVFRVTITFKKHNSVYYVQNLNAEECVDNQRLQLRILQQIHYMMSKRTQVDTAMQNLDYNYKPLIERKRRLLGFLDSAEYKQVRNLYNSNMPINKDLFDSAFANIVCVYPDLYHKFIKGYSYEQIKNDLFGLKKYYSSRSDMLLDALAVPKTTAEKMADTAKKLGCTVENTSGGNEISVRTSESIVFFINKMTDPYCVLETLYDEFKHNKMEAIAAERERRLREQEEREARREEEYYEGGSSGFLGDIFKTAAGVALGNKASGNRGRNDGSGRQNLFGTSLCKYGKRNQSGVRIDCSMGCKVSRECTQRGRYKVGSKW